MRSTYASCIGILHSLILWTRWHAGEFLYANYSHIVVSHGVRTVYPANDVWFTPVDGAGVNSMALLVSGEYVGLPLYGLQLL